MNKTPYPVVTDRLSVYVNVLLTYLFSFFANIINKNHLYSYYRHLFIPLFDTYVKPNGYTVISKIFVISFVVVTIIYKT